jgi:hypothetical protein
MATMVMEFVSLLTGEGGDAVFSVVPGPMRIERFPDFGFDGMLFFAFLVISYRHGDNLIMASIPDIGTVTRSRGSIDKQHGSGKRGYNESSCTNGTTLLVPLIAVNLEKRKDDRYFSINNGSFHSLR